MKVRGFHSTFTKMTVFFSVFGMIPIVVISSIFFHWYYSDAEEATINNYTQITDYVERNISSIISQVDETSGYMYEFSIDKYEHLYNLLLDEGLNKTEKKIYMNKMMQDMLMGSEYISAIRFYASTGEVYALFQGQGRSLQDEKKVLNEVTFQKENMQGMILMPAVSEAEYCTNSNEYVFSIIRTYMDTSTVKSIEEDCLGTLYIDIDITDIQKLVENVEVGEEGNIYVMNPETDQWMFSTNQNAFGDESISADIKAGNMETVISKGSHWLFCLQLTDTDYYVVVQIFSEDVMDTYLKNRTFIFIILAFAIFILSIAYISFSGRMNQPAKKLKRAMEQVQKGDLKVHVDIRTDDEMEYLSEGFNKMVEDLQYYIDEVYVANIRQKEAELDALKMQIQPHYLYNTLDVIRMTAIENNDRKTARLLESLARQLRYVIGQKKETVPLYMELDSIREYIVLMNARYGDKFQINVNVLDEDRRLHVLKLLLQPMVENCIKYGLSDKEGTGTIEVNVKRFEDYLEIIVMDDGIGMTKEQEEYIQDALKRKDNGKSERQGNDGIGIKNVNERIKLGCGEEYGMTLTSYENMGTRVKIKLPIWEGDKNVVNDSGR